VKGKRRGRRRSPRSGAHWQGHYLPGITNKMKLNEGGVLHDIERVDESQRRAGDLHVYTVRRAVP
jgi:hypothetical protein